MIVNNHHKTASGDTPTVCRMPLLLVLYDADIVNISSKYIFRCPFLSPPPPRPSLPSAQCRRWADTKRKKRPRCVLLHAVNLQQDWKTAREKVSCGHTALDVWVVEVLCGGVVSVFVVCRHASGLAFDGVRFPIMLIIKIIIHHRNCRNIPALFQIIKKGYNMLRF